MTGTIITLVLILLGAAAVPVMAWLALACLTRCRGRRALSVWTAVFAGALALLTAGSGLLAALDLAWRSWVKYVLYAALFTGCAGMMGTAIRMLPELLAAWPERNLRSWQIIACGAFCVVLLNMLVLGRMLLAFTTGEERVVSRGGQQVVEVDESWMDYYVAYYPYRGPLLRGGTALEVVAEKLSPKEAVR